MPVKTFDINHDIETDSLAENISNKWISWINGRQQLKNATERYYSTCTALPQIPFTDRLQTPGAVMYIFQR